MGTNCPKIVFYEWSNIKSQPIGFLTIEDFKKFCTESKINITSNNDFYLTNYNTIYAICTKGKSELVLSGDYKNLRKNFSKHNRKNFVNGI